MVSLYCEYKSIGMDYDDSIRNTTLLWYIYIVDIKAVKLTTMKLSSFRLERFIKRFFQMTFIWPTY